LDLPLWVLCGGGGGEGEKSSLGNTTEQSHALHSINSNQKKRS